MPAALKFLAHFSGSPGDQTFVDVSPSAHTITPIGNPYLVAGGKWGSAFEAAGAEGLAIPATLFAFGSGNFSVDGWFNIASGDEGQQACLYNQTSIRIMIESGDVVVYLRTGSSPVFNHELRYAITVIPDTWMHWGVVRNGSSLFVLFDGLVMDAYQIYSEALVAAAGVVTFGVESDSSGALYHFTGLLDEIAVFVGGYNPGIVIASDEQTYTKPSDENYVTKRYILNPNGQSGNFYDSFGEADLDSNRWLTVNHNLNQTVVKVIIADNDSPRKEIVPDDVHFLNTNTCYVDLSSYGTLTGTWIVNVIKGGSGSGSGSATTMAAEDVTVDQTSMTGILAASGALDAQTDLELIDAKLVTVDAAIAAKLDKAAVSREFTTNDDVVNGDEAKYLYGDSSGSLVLSLNSGLTLTQCVVIQLGAGTVSIAGDSSVTLNGVAGGSCDISAQYGAVTLIRIGTDEWIVFGAHGGVA